MTKYNSKCISTHSKLLATVIAGFFLFGITFQIPAASFHPVIYNYAMREMARNAGTQNWQIAQDANGNIFVANNKGLLLFNGYKWELIPLPGDQAVRSVYIDGDSIFVGCYEELGYFKRNDTGKFIYNPLKNRLQNTTLKNEDFWKIFRCNDKIYFQSFETIYAYDGQHIRAALPQGFHPLYFHKVSDSDLFIQAINGDYYRFFENGKNPQILIPRSQVYNDNIVSALRDNDGSTLLLTEYSGIFRRYNDGRIVPIPTSIDASLKASQVNRAVLTNDGLMVIGTIRDGVFAIDRNGRMHWHFSSDNGLNNNTVLGLLCDHNNNIWVALDNGVATIRSGIPVEVLVPNRSDDQIGMIYDISIRPDGILLPTNQALYWWDKSNGNFSTVNGTNGQNWYVTDLGGTTFIGNYAQTKTLQGNHTATPIDGTSGGSTCIKEATIHGQHIALESSYSTLRIYRKDDSEKWHFSNNIDGLFAPIRQFEIDAAGTIWASNLNRGIIRIELDRELKKVASSKVFRSFDGENSANFVMKIRGSIAFSDSHQLYVYNELNDTITPFSKLNDRLFITTDIHSATDAGGGRFWLSGRDNYFLVDGNNNQFKVIRHIPVVSLGLENNEGNDKVRLDGDYAYFNLNNGIARTYVSDSITPGFMPELQLTKVVDTAEDTETWLSVNSGGKASSDGNVKFYFSFPNFSGELILFRFQLYRNGELKNKQVLELPEIAYTSLPAGSYSLIVEAVNCSGEIVSRLEYKLQVPQPWFLSAWAIIMYVILFLGSIIIVSKVITSHAVAKRQKEFEIERDKQNIKMLEQEKLLSEQHRQMLEAELSEKGKEIAQMALGVYSREQVINNLKESISTQQGSEEGFSRKQMKELLSRIKSDMSDLEFWHIYQKNIDLIHEHFFRNLRERYPSLTHSDLRFCALLRLNLSTKDIAKFTNLTVRGVETARYRLRRKFNIPSDMSLVTFLIEMK
jgi:DNA-binding CsgD family transcriptional regulator